MASPDAALDRAVTAALMLIVVLSGAELVHAIDRRDLFGQSLSLVVLLLALAPLSSETRAWLHRRHSL